ncbi:MAG: FAD:protein FMN transferase [Ruminococcus sp.]|nr:FAD:protein FMN transferase [Ruminococcus sp.]
MKRFFAVLSVLTLLLTGCADKSASISAHAKSRSIFAMDTYMELKAYGDNADAALDRAVSRINEIEAELSVTLPDSDISTLNASSGEPVEVSRDCAWLISNAIKYGDMTGGSLDITLYPVVKEWGFTTGDHNIPDAARLAELLSNVDYSAVSVDGTEVALPKNAEVDLGALAKGFTSSEVAAIFKEDGVRSAIVSLGGNVQAIGSKPDGSDWRVSVRDPFAPETDMCIVEISDAAVITSGNYERYFTGEDGRNYWHIIDPADGYPADNGLVSVTVIGSDGLMCDALSTALFVAGKDSAADIWRKEGGFELILVTDDAEVFYTQGLEGKFTNVSSMTAEVISR